MEITDDRDGVYGAGGNVIIGAGDNLEERQIDGESKQVIFKNCALFTDCISEMNNTQVDYAKYLNVGIDLVEYSNNYSEICGSFRQCFKDKQNGADIANSDKFKFKIKN